MKRTAFGEPVLQPGDDIGAAFSETFDTDIEEALVARFIEDDPNVGWSCTIEDGNCNEMQVHDFKSKEELVAYLKGARVEIEE